MAVALRGALTRHDMVMDHVSTLCDAELVIGDGAYDAVLLDRQLPDGDGLELIPKIRKKGLTLPIIVITAKGEVPDRITGLETGADDYLAKPFVFDELLARLRAVMRRSETLRPALISIGRLSFDPTYCDIIVSGLRLEMPRREALVLECLMRRAGRMVARPAGVGALLGVEHQIQEKPHQYHQSRLRRKLAASQAGVVINVIRGVGYLLREAS